MDNQGLGMIITVFVIVGGIVVVGGGIIGVAYAMDAPLDATVTDRQCIGAEPTVGVKTKLFGIKSKVVVGATECGIIQKGNFVRYHIQSERTIIFESEGGSCIYDSDPSKVCQ